MRVARSKISEVVAEKTLSKGISKKLSREIAAYLLSSKRTDELSSILRDVQLDWAEHDVIDVAAISAFPISGDVRKDIDKVIRGLYPNAKRIIVTDVHDSNVIGGVRLEFANQQLDLSVQSKLNKFKQLAVAGKD